MTLQLIIILFMNIETCCIELSIYLRKQNKCFEVKKINNLSKINK